MSCHIVKGASNFKVPISHMPSSGGENNNKRAINVISSDAIKE